MPKTRDGVVLFITNLFCGVPRYDLPTWELLREVLEKKIWLLDFTSLEEVKKAHNYDYVLECMLNR